MIPRRSVLAVAVTAALWAALIGPAALAEDEPTEGATTTTTTIPGVTPAPEASTDAGEGEPTPEAQTPGVEEVEAVEEVALPSWVVGGMIFPIVGSTSYEQGFGDCRDGCTRLHEGIDILTHGWKGVPVVASHGGTVTWAHVGGELAGCSVTIADHEGWSTHYVHLNTDIPGTDIPAADCFAPGIEIGAEVAAGTLLGWVGDAGNAESTTPHIHFEINDPDGVAIDPWTSLQASVRISHGWVDAADLAEVATAATVGHPPTVYVISEGDIPSFVAARETLARIDVPVVVYADSDVDALREPLSAIRPDSIVVLTSRDAPPQLLDALRSISGIVEVQRIAAPPDDLDFDEGSLDSAVIGGAIVSDDATTDSEDDEVVSDPRRHEEVDPWFATVVGSVSDASERRIVRQLGDDAAQAPILLLGGRGAPRSAGMSTSTYPDPDITLTVVWWPGPDGWESAGSLDEGSPSTLAYVRGSELDAATLSYLTSLAVAPAMPLWRDQPTSRVTRSL